MIIFYFEWIIIIIFIIGNMIFVYKRKHSLVVLFSLEFIVLSIFFLIVLINLSYDIFMLMVFLVFSVGH